MVRVPSRRTIGTVARTPPRELADGLVVATLGAAAELLLRCRVGLPRLCRLFRVRLDLSGSSDPRDPEPLPAWAAARLRSTRRVMRHWPVDGPCLRHSLVLGFRLRGLEPSLRIGVRSGSAGPVAHAWIEVAGQSLDPASAGYEPF